MRPSRIVDGTLVPVRDRIIDASSRHYRFSVNVQVVVDADTRLVAASARPTPGNKVDAHVRRESGLPATAARTRAMADGAYLGSGSIVPHRRRAGPDAASCAARRRATPNTDGDGPVSNTRGWLAVRGSPADAVSNSSRRFFGASFGLLPTTRSARRGRS